ncbi:SCO7613 C-terminal domain-containing membrane protein [Streptomyces xinghaiensis]|uniref:SCO7613 C-terminal domain-containing membrane protein n=1 Tax=Streptomyces xinghaiensis TaxID=1038928 RepID=UPI00343A7C4D
MENEPPPAPTHQGNPEAELREIDRALAWIDAERARLLTRRSELLVRLWGQQSAALPVARARRGAVPHPGTADRRETGAPAVRNVLLTLGGILLAVAVIAFTVLSWGRMGIGGRAVVLGVLTVCALATPLPLLRRALGATAEVIACLGLLLLVLDAYALHRVSLPGVDGTAYAAVVSAVLAVVWAGYSRLLSRHVSPPVAGRASPATGAGRRSGAGTAAGTAAGGADAGTAPGAVPAPGTGAVGAAAMGGGVAGSAAEGSACGAPGGGAPAPSAPGGGAPDCGAPGRALPDGGGRVPRLIPGLAVLLAQLPLLLWSIAVEADAFGSGAALLATAALDAVIALRFAQPAIRRTAAVLGTLAGVFGLIPAVWMSVTASNVAEAARAAVLLSGAAVVLWSVAARLPAPLAAATRPGTAQDARPPAGAGTAPGAVPSSAPGRGPALVSLALRSHRGPRARLLSPAVPGAVAGLAVVTAAGGLLRSALPDGFGVAGYLLCAALLPYAVGALGGRVPERARDRGTAVAAGLVHALALLWVLPDTASALLGPAGWVDAVWEGAPRGARAAVAPGVIWAGDTVVPVVLAMLAVSLCAGSRLRAERPGTATDAGTVAAPGTAAAPWPGYRTALAAALVLAAAAAAVLPVTLDLPYPVAVLLLAAQAAVLLVAAGTSGSVVLSRTALACAVAVAGTASAWSLAERPVTQGALAALLTAFAVAAVTSPADDRVRQPVTACAAVASAVGLVVAVCADAGLPAHRTAFAVLAAAAAVELLASRLRRRPAGLPLEIAGAAIALLAVGLAVTGPAAVLAAVLALAGVVAAGCALRADRRRTAGYAATALFVLATWVRLGAAGVEEPEAYTLPVTVPALVVGLLRRRADATASSWVAYGPGLSVTLLPSLAAVWADSGWTRPLLLGLAALALTLLGARERLQAPLLLGGGGLALVALHELAPYLAQMAGALPRWVPPALAGLLLLGAGATYEQRLRDARRLRDLLARMR